MVLATHELKPQRNPALRCTDGLELMDEQEVKMQMGRVTKYRELEKVRDEIYAAPVFSGRLGVLTDVETELRKMPRQLASAGIANGAKVLELAADIVATSGRQAVALRDATTLLGEIIRDEVNAQDECEKWLRAYGPNDKIQPQAGRK